MPKRKAGDPEAQNYLNGKAFRSLSNKLLPYDNLKVEPFFWSPALSYFAPTYVEGSSVAQEALESARLGRDICWEEQKQHDAGIEHNSIHICISQT